MRFVGRLARLSFAVFIVALVGMAAGCETDPPGASARVITHRSQLIGGDRAIGEIGDFIIENEKVRFVVHKAGFSRGFGVYGGSLIDADLRRPSEYSDSGDGHGFDNFSEMFPAMFIQAVAVDDVSILNDGTDGGPAQIAVTGIGGDFFEFLGVFNRLITGSHELWSDPYSEARLRYTTIYELPPGAQYLRVRFQVTNISAVDLPFPSPEAELLDSQGLPTQDFHVPVGDVALFGATNRAFIPGIGFDLRTALEASYNDPNIEWPAFPGIVADFVASKSEHTSYGIVAQPSERNFVAANKQYYDKNGTVVTNSSMLVPFMTSGAFGIFYDSAPDSLAVGESFESVKYFVVGTGDVGSVVDVIHEIKGLATGRLGGIVVDAVTSAPSEGAMVIVYNRDEDNARRPYSQYDVQTGGRFSGTLPPGSYSLRVSGEARVLSPFVDFEIVANEDTAVRVESTPSATIVVHTSGENGQPLPSKATAVGRYDAAHAGEDITSFLFNLEAGEELRNTDLDVDDPNDPDTLRYIEAIAFMDEGVAELQVRPGTYEVVSSRGPEYDLASTTVTVDANKSATVSHVLHRVVDTTGWVSVDSHVHSRASTDSALSLDERVRSLAAEGIDVPIATDHNVVTDYAPYVARNNLTQWMHPIVGVELTTLETGHFNGYPLRYNAGLSTHGSFEWGQLRPDEIFNRVRDLGSLLSHETVIQVNHPRDTVLGYYEQYDRHPLDHSHDVPAGLLASFTQPYGPAFFDDEGESTFSFNYDAVELLNGKLYGQIHHYRVPESLPPGELPDDIPPAGTILTDADGAVGFPGVVDDWFNLLNLGYRYIGVGTGDSHSSHDEAGQFRTMVFVGDDRPESVTDQILVNALRTRRAVATNGPLIDFYINDPVAGVMGQTIVDGDGTVSLTLKLTSAPWAGVRRVNIYRNGTIAHTMLVAPGRNLATNPINETIELELDKDGETLKDSWFVVEAVGFDNMFPAVRPLEIPPLLLLDAVGALAGPLGFGQDEFGALRPPETFAVTPYAITNPVWVTRTDAAFEAPGIVPLDELNDIANYSYLQEGVHPIWSVGRPQRKVRRYTEGTERSDPVHRKVPYFYPVRGDMLDVRMALCRYGLPHGHGL